MNGNRLDHDRWSALWARVAPGVADADGGDAVFAHLQRRYNEAGRGYHNARHITECLTLFDEVASRAADPLALELAIWFHDAIYNPRARDNEERSAQLASEAIARAGGAAGLASRVHALVLATRAHEPGAGSDAPWMLDIDLAILGQSAAVFDAYDAAIRAEYAWVEPAVFCTQRAQVLAGFLARPQIYLTPFFRQRFETSARGNLRRSIKRLETKTPAGKVGRGRH